MSWRIVDIVDGKEQNAAHPVSDEAIFHVLMNHFNLSPMPKLGAWQVIEVAPGRLILERKMEYVKSYLRRFEYVADATGKGS